MQLAQSISQIAAAAGGRLKGLLESAAARRLLAAASSANDRSRTPPADAPPGESPPADRRESASGRDLLRDWQRLAKRNLALVGLFSVFVNLLMLTIPIYLFQLSDRVLTSGSRDTLVMLTLLALGFIGVLCLLDQARRQLLARLATHMETMLAGPVLAGLVGTNQSGQTGSVAALRSLQQVRSFVSSPVMLMLFDAPLAPLYFAAVFLIHFELGLIVLGAGGVLILIALINQRLTAEQVSKAGQHAAKADAQAEALARNAQVINAMGMLNEGVLLWGREQAKAMTLQVGAQDRNVWIGSLSKFARLMTQVAMLGWGAYLALTGHLTGGMMIAASIIAGRALQPIEGMIDGWKSVLQTRTAYARIKSMIEALQNEKERLKLPRPKGHLSVDKLLYIPPGSKEPVLNGVSFELEPGHSLAILGNSGSGKSTLARILVGCLTPTAGRVRLDSTELRNWDRRQFGEFTGYLPQEVELFPGSIKANIARMREDLPDEAIYEAAVVSSVHEMICHLPQGYETVLDNHGSPLSGGQKQRIALARAFFGNPSLVVLDEPNSNLDALGEDALGETFKRARERGVTVVVITQRPALLQNVDRVMILKNGRVDAFGPPGKVLHRVVQPRSPAPAALPAAEAPRGPETKAG